VALRQVIVVVRQPSAHVSARRQPGVLERHSLVLVGVVDDLHGDAAVGVGEGGGVESGCGVAAGDGGADAVGALLDEAGAEVGEGPEALGWGDDVGGGIDVDEHLIVGVVSCTPPVAHGGDVAVAVATEDVVGPSKAVTW